MPGTKEKSTVVDFVVTVSYIPWESIHSKNWKHKNKWIIVFYIAHADIKSTGAANIEVPGRINVIANLPHAR